jgi:ribosomal protein S18 acetylase RimI-like enzyme
MLRSARPSDTGDLLDVAVATTLFDVESAAALLGSVLSEWHAERLGAGHTVAVWARDDRRPEGWVYYAPDAYAAQVWNLWWIGVRPDAQGTGIGQALLAHVEAQVRAGDGRLLVIETSALPPLGRARAFYRRHGYAECGQIPDYYGVGDGKVIFAKRLDGPASSGVA